MAGEDVGQWSLRNNKSPAWPIIRLVTVAIVASTAFTVLYTHGYDVLKDSATLALILSVVGGVDGLQRWITRGTFSSGDETSD